MGWFGEKKSRDEVVGELRKNAQDFSDEGDHVWCLYPWHDGDHVIVLFLLDKHDDLIMVKDISESMGPFVYDCPLRFLARASAQSREWRKKVVRYHQAIERNIV